MSLENKVALITGASGGIGRAAALEFTKRGARVALSDVLEAEGYETVELVRQAGGEAFFMVADMREESQIKAMVEATISQYGRLDFGINNAARVINPGPLHEMTSETWDTVININLRGVFLCMKYEIPEILKVGGGAIVNVSSLTGTIGFPNMAHYVASKHGVTGLTKAAALDYSRLGIRINSVHPGVIATPMAVGFFGSMEAVYENSVGMHPIGRAGEPEEVARMIAVLCTEDASFVTGAQIAVDGGYTTA